MATIRESGLFEARDEMSEADKVYAHLEDAEIGMMIATWTWTGCWGTTSAPTANPWYVAVRRFHRDHPGEGTFVTISNAGFEVADWATTQQNVEGRRKRAARQMTEPRVRSMPLTARR